MYAPGGEAVKVGESLTHKHELQQEVAAGEQEQDVGPEISVIRQANRGWKSCCLAYLIIIIRETFV